MEVHTVLHASRVLSVDADVESRSFLSRTCGGSGCDVLEATDGHDALVKALPGPHPRPVRPGDRWGTTSPPEPALRCVTCHGMLGYERSIEIPGVPPLDGWEKYTCPRCGASEYRSRTRARYRTGS